MLCRLVCLTYLDDHAITLSRQSGYVRTGCLNHVVTGKNKEARGIARQVETVRTQTIACALGGNGKKVRARERVNAKEGAVSVSVSVSVWVSRCEREEA